MNENYVDIVVADAVEYIFEEMVKKGYTVGSDDKIALHDFVHIFADYLDLMREK
jgi:hypothetical protein